MVQQCKQERAARLSDEAMAAQVPTWDKGGEVFKVRNKNRSLNFFSNGWVGDDEFQMSFPFGYIFGLFWRGMLVSGNVYTLEN